MAQVGDRVVIADDSEANGDHGSIHMVQEDGVVIVELDGGGLWPCFGPDDFEAEETQAYARDLFAAANEATKRLAEREQETSEARRVTREIGEELDRLGAPAEQPSGFGYSPVGRLRALAADTIGNCFGAAMDALAENARSLRGKLEKERKEGRRIRKEVEACVREMYRIRESEHCWHNGVRCGNFPEEGHCKGECPLVRLRKIAKIHWQEDGGVR